MFSRRCDHRLSSSSETVVCYCFHHLCRSFHRMSPSSSTCLQCLRRQRLLSLTEIDEIRQKLSLNRGRWRHCAMISFDILWRQVNYIIKSNRNEYSNLIKTVQYRYSTFVHTMLQWRHFIEIDCRPITEHVVGLLIIYWHNYLAWRSKTQIANFGVSFWLTCFKFDFEPSSVYICLFRNGVLLPI